MAIREIVQYPAEVLEQECERVTVFDKKLANLVKDMYDTMVAADGVGLAAPQIGIAKQIAIVDIDDENGTIELINPVIMERKGEQVGPEGCLSFPGLFGDVKRAEYVKVRTQNRRGKIRIIEAKGFLARALQHEIDHLHGVLFTSQVLRYYEEDELEQSEGV
ncbi:peptide deformylase [Metabacillus fastidiosus]|uniref:Peptide deformylase n=1 Tax=Metabacillus fastidiosus TaxID=1458 RepID=A0ABU6NX43_9BACI|nr:peptide deformylase [Metabacillus fastidiosus]MEC2074636.1 peptide deformylase [Metabacillus fastidiosus]MED4401611.1 peptide deformylase [Metabacillus fastidiosus]MED4452830.1 peptide deformylase [Metabacillus fastidiosus]MED4463250.1 peptide deformylase [Metabacillus fastidiosus]MED4532593.1 peptide deformylase [Metabacillus fastidiosus]